MDDSLVFPCGRRVPNRFVKAAMYESMAHFGGGPPTKQHLKLYSRWGVGGWGMIITGNVQVSRLHLTLGRDVTLPKNSLEIESFKDWASCISVESTDSKPLTIMQLSHAGRQSPRFIGGRLPWTPPEAPSSNPMAPNESFLARLVFSLLFQSPRSMSTQDIHSVTSAFLEGAKTASRAGFDGIQLHASHGYLLSQFLSVRNNHRSDEYGPPNELRLLRQIVDAIRKEPDIPQTFVIGVKLNAGDYAKDRLDGTCALLHVRSIAEWRQVDFLEISGGDYESPDFLATNNARQAIFSEFSQKAAECVAQVGGSVPLIMLTGSMRSVSTIRDCLVRKHADLIGIGRPSILYPDLPLKLARQQDFPFIPDTPNLPRWLANLLQVKLVGAGLDTAVWIRAMKRLARADTRTLEGNAIDAFFYILLDTSPITPFLGILLLALIVATLVYCNSHW